MARLSRRICFHSFRKQQLDYKLLEILSYKLNFSYNLLHCGFDWGHLRPNRTWSGIIGNLVNEVQYHLFEGNKFTLMRSS